MANNESAPPYPWTPEQSARMQIYNGPNLTQGTPLDGSVLAQRVTQGPPAGLSPQELIAKLRRDQGGAAPAAAQFPDVPAFNTGTYAHLGGPAGPDAMMALASAMGPKRIGNFAANDYAPDAMAAAKMNQQGDAETSRLFQGLMGQG